MQMHSSRLATFIGQLAGLHSEQTSYSVTRPNQSAIMHVPDKPESHSAPQLPMKKRQPGYLHGKNTESHA